MAVIAVYAGHGGRDPGATANGLREKDFTLAISNAVTSILRGWGYTVINNRTTDTDRSITQDANLANERRASALVEIHLNSNEGTPGTGSEAFVSIRDQGPARNLANAMLSRLAALGFRNRGVFTSVNANGQDTLGILRLTNMPAVLLEVAFINNPQDMARLNVNTAANAIAEGIRQAFPLAAGGTNTANPSSAGGIMPPYPGVVLRQNMRGESVRQVQRCINRVATRERALGRLTEDGIFGPLTNCAVTTFQRLQGLTPDAAVGPITWAALTRECGSA
ncbi:MAG: N-acetylmuramoyl-L-alanine amidase [Defluviitaleaceae bacterium]|nr:N-acetylmuramoyl-L-alanine amidase [Defluviitaleaceae bacterium]